MNTHRRLLVRTAAVVLTIAMTSGAAGVRAQSVSARDAAGAAGAGPLVRVLTGAVLGTAWKADNTPYPEARIRLRNAENGRGVARTFSDADGRFRFEDVAPGAYVAELLDRDDKVLAVGDVFAVAPGAQSTTVVRLASKAPWFAGFFGNAAAAAIAAASTIGVTATGSSGRPVSAQ